MIKAKKIITILLTIIMVCLVGNNTTFASELNRDNSDTDLIIVDEDSIDPCYLNIEGISASITSKGVKAYLTTDVVAKSKNNIKILMCLERLDGSTYKPIADWTNSGYGSTLSIDASRVINVAKKYRLRSVVTVGTESVTVYRYL